MPSSHPFKLKNYGLTLVLILFFSLSISGQILTGYHTYNDEREKDHLVKLNNVGEYLHSGHFESAVFENMESEFLQMAFFVYLTMCLIQKGSGESKKPPEEMTTQDLAEEKKEQEYCRKQSKAHPILWPLYQNSLTLAMLTLFVISFLLHARGSHILINEDNQSQGKEVISYWQVFSQNEFWFESFQNWQSEFFSIAVMVVFGIFLRQKNSPQSKKMNDPWWKTGSG